MSRDGSMVILGIVIGTLWVSLLLFGILFFGTMIFELGTREFLGLLFGRDGA